MTLSLSVIVKPKTSSDGTLAANPMITVAPADSRPERPASAAARLLKQRNPVLLGGADVRISAS